MGYSLALLLATRSSGATSAEARVVRDRASDLLASRERSFALFGAKRKLIDRLSELALECAHDGWDGDEAVALTTNVVERAAAFVRALPDALPLPEAAIDPDGAISFDWIRSRARVFSVSIGSTNRLAYAWIDGTDRGRGVARFEGDAIPPKILSGIRDVTDARPSALWVA